MWMAGAGVGIMAGDGVGVMSESMNGLPRVECNTHVQSVERRSRGSGCCLQQGCKPFIWFVIQTTNANQSGSLS